MPTPMPTIAAVRGRPVGDVDHAPQQLSERDRHAEAEHRGEERQPHRHRGAEGEQQDQGGGDEADALRADGRRLGQRRDRAADLDLEGVVACGEDGFDERLGLRRACTRLTVMSRATTAYAVVPSVRDLAAPPSPNGLATPDDVASRATSAKIASARSRTSAEENPLLGVQHDLDGVARLLRELSSQCLRGGLRLGAGLEVVLLGLPAERARQERRTPPAREPARTTTRRCRKHQSARLYQHVGLLS